MNVYIDNLLEANTELLVTNLAPVYQELNLYDKVLSNNVVFIGTDTTITAAWDINIFADAIAILDSNWTIGTLTVESQGQTVFNESITSRGKNTIIKLPKVYMISSITLTLTAMDQLYIGILFVGKRIKLPFFNVGMKYKRDMRAKAERTWLGVVYGLKKPSLQSFDINFQYIDNDIRLMLEDYMDRVQSIQPHLVEPFETEAFPPIWATLEDAGSFDKQKENGFYWNTSLGYMEAK